MVDALDPKDTKLEKREKVPVREGEAVPDPEKDKAVGPILGGRVLAKAYNRPKATPVRKTKDGKEVPGAREIPTVNHAVTVTSEVYGDGFTFLNVKCTRGEQKALSGDIGYRVLLVDEETLEETEYIFIIPGEAYEHIKDALPPVSDTEGMTLSEYDKFQKEEADKESKRRSPVRDRGRVPPTQLPAPPSTKPVPTPH